MVVKDLRSSGGTHDGDRVFVLRFWIERAAGPEATALWRAKVTELSSGEAKHVDSVDEALALVRSEMNRASGVGAAAPG